MNKLFVTALITIFGISISAQPAEFDRLYHTYKGEQGVVALKIPGIVMKIAGSIADLDKAERELLRSLRSVTILTIEEPHLYPDVNFSEEINLSSMKDHYQVLLEVHDGEEDVIIAAREKDSKIRDLVVVVGGDENVLVHVSGRMHADLLQNLAEVAGVKELQYTSQLPQ